MKQFILRLLLIYTLLSVIIVPGIIIALKYEDHETHYPRKALYVVNMTGDSISVHISGTYTRAERRKMKDKPDEYTFAENTQSMPYHWGEDVERQAVQFRIPHKHNKEIEFPADFKIHIRSPKGEITLDKISFEQQISGNKYGRNWWAIYVEPHWLEPKIETIDTTVFESNGICYRYLPDPGEVEVTYGPTYRDSVFVPKSVAYNGKTYRVTSIGNYAMAGDRQAALRLIEKGVFKGDSGLRWISFPDSLRTIGREAFAFCTVLETFTFPETLETIDQWAFEHCWSITSVTIPPRISVIRVRSFNGCRKLERLTIPQTVTSIEALAFAQCKALKNVEVYWQAPIELTEEDTPFNWVDLSRATLTVPAGTRQLYQTATVWKEFGTIVEK